MRVFLTGATGFVGRHMLVRLLQEGYSICAFTRAPRGQGAAVAAIASSNPPAGWQEAVDVAIGDVVSGAGLDEGLRGCEAVIHLVGIIIEKGANTYEAVHHIGTRNVVQAAKRAGIKRFVHMSALGARLDGVAAYQTSKWRGQEEVRLSGIPFCILRPSLIFGPGDGFVTQMMDIMRKAPLVRPVPGSGAPRFRPVFIGDVALCFARALTAEGATNQTIDLGGADELSLNQVLAEVARCAGIHKPAVHIPLPVMFLGAAIAQALLPNPPVTVPQLRMLEEGSTCDIERMRRIFSIEPQSFRGCGREGRA